MGSKSLIKKDARDFIFTLSANVFSLITGLITTFFLPKYLGLDEYAYLRIFTFYVGYVGLFQLGYNDGIYVRYGNLDYNMLHKEKFRLYFRFLIIFQTIITLILLFLSILLIKEYNRLVIFCFISVNTILIGANGFFVLINQFTKRFKIYSITLMLSNLIYTLVSLLFLKASLTKYIYFVLLQTGTNIMSLLINIIKSRDIVFGKTEKISSYIFDIKENFKVGLFVTVGNLMGMIILGIDRIYIDKFFSLKVFAMYSFAVSLMGIIYTLLSAVTTFIYPYLTRMKEHKVKEAYEAIKLIVMIIISFLLSFYFIIKFIVLRYIPKYEEALYLTSILFPTVLLNGQISIIISNYYKVLKLQKQYTINNILVMLLSVVLNTAAYVIFKKPEAIAFSLLITFFIWLLYSDLFFIKKLNLNLKKLIFLNLLIITWFYVASINFNWILGFISYNLGLGLLFYIFCHKEIKKIIKVKGESL